MKSSWELFPATFLVQIVRATYFYNFKAVDENDEEYIMVCEL